MAVVVTVSDRCASGDRVDRSGPRAVELLRAAGYEAGPARVVPDGASSVETAIRSALDDGARLIVTTGGTGVGPRDRTPEGTRPHIELELPGVAELLRRTGTEKTPMAAISRGLIGVSPGSRALIVNLPGSVSGVEQGLQTLLPLTQHILDQLTGADH